MRTRNPPPAAADAAALERLGEYALRYVKPGHTIGLGTGHAAAAFIRALIASGIQVRGVPTSRHSEQMAREGGIEIVGLDAVDRIDVTIDGADEVDPRLNLIKGLGGALVREKIVAVSSRREIIVVGFEKLVRRLGEHGILPVEVVPFAAPLCLRRLKKLGLRPALRQNPDGTETVSDNGNLIVDCKVDSTLNARRVTRELQEMTGVVDHGLFLGLAHTVLVAEADGTIEVINRPQ
ncbi:MAG TPA: ribose-5-phosphate isomerase RpiA [Candidatus Binataceae bacterium]|jgi:ribose 5-phosphate isomerase A|nr:ribose-5-phosphate isomerase RpiA [Candidatus Binataceae bacterium]